MIYYVIHVSNGNLQIPSITEYDNLDSAKVNYHQRCATLWNEPSVITGYVALMDNQLDIVEGYKEFIHHEVQPTPEPVVSQPTEE